MENVLRAATVYLLLMVVFRIAGRRTLASITTFDFILLLIISEATQNALIGADLSVTGGMLVVITLLALDIGMSLLKERFPALEKWLDGLPTVLIEDGKLHEDRLQRARVDVNDILTSARESQGLERIDQIKYAVLERSGGISIIPKKEAR